MTESIRVVVVDDQALFREALIGLLGLHSDLCVVAEGENGAEAIEAVRRDPPNVVLVDLEMPVLGGVDAIRTIHAEFPGVATIALTTFADDVSIFDALEAGAIGYLLKDVSSQALADAIRQGAQGRSILAPVVAARVVARVRQQAQQPAAAASAVHKLTSREREVLGLLARGARNKEIAGTLHLAEGTVKNHVTAIFGKIGVDDRLQAAMFARSHGLHRPAS